MQDILKIQMARAGKYKVKAVCKRLPCQCSTEETHIFTGSGTPLTLSSTQHAASEGGHSSATARRAVCTERANCPLPTFPVSAIAFLSQACGSPKSSGGSVQLSSSAPHAMR